MLTLNDGRAELWQWDTGRTLAVDVDCSQVHFSNKVFGRSIDVDVVDGAAIIPDVLLQTDNDLNVWAFVGTAENGYTKISKTFRVNRRNKPADYVFTPTDQTTLAGLVKRIDKIEETQGPDAIKNAVEGYLEQNPVEVPVKSVNGKTGTVELNAEDVGAIAETQLQKAINTALEQAKASGEFGGADGADGKSAYQYAVEGGYTGTEAEFAAKLAEEIQTVDDTLTQRGQAADSAAVGDAINLLSEEIANLQTSGLTIAQINALDGMFKVAAYIKADVSTEYSAFKTAFGIEDSGDTEPEKTLTSISATYSGGDVAVGTAVTDLTGIVVTAHYSDGSNATVTGYTLSGIIAEGSNTIDVTYGGMTTTFTVTGVAESGGDTENVSNETKWTNGVAYSYTPVENEYVETNGTITQYNAWNRTPHLYCAGASKLRIEILTATSMIGSSADNEKYNVFYDANKNFIQNFSFHGLDGSTLGAYFDVEVPTNAAYFIASHKKGVISSSPYISITPYA